MVLPLVKFGTLLVRTVSKPVANALKVFKKKEEGRKEKKERSKKRSFDPSISIGISEDPKKILPTSPRLLRPLPLH